MDPATARRLAATQRKFVQNMVDRMHRLTAGKRPATVIEWPHLIDGKHRPSMTVAELRERIDYWTHWLERHPE